MGFVSPEHFARLKDIVAEVNWSLDTLVLVYRACSLGRLIHIDSDPRRSALQILNELNRSAGGTRFPLLEGVQWLARMAPPGDQAVISKLLTWVNVAAQQIGLSPHDLAALRDRVAQAALPTPPTNPHLLVALRPKGARITSVFRRGCGPTSIPVAFARTSHGRSRNFPGSWKAS